MSVEAVCLCSCVWIHTFSFVCYLHSLHRSPVSPESPPWRTCEPFVWSTVCALWCQLIQLSGQLLSTLLTAGLIGLQLVFASEPLQSSYDANFGSPMCSENDADTSQMDLFMNFLCTNNTWSHKIWCDDDLNTQTLVTLHCVSLCGANYSGRTYLSCFMDSSLQHS